jgi:hypothetical protein
MYFKGDGLQLLKDYFAQTAGIFNISNISISLANPWKLPPLLDPLNTNVRHLSGENGLGAIGTLPGVSSSPISVFDTGRLRFTRTTGITLLSTDIPRVIAAISAVRRPSATNMLIAMTDVPVTQIGTPFLHPTYYDGSVAGRTLTATLTVGASYITVAGTWNTLYASWRANGANYCRITTGASKGVYRIRHYSITGAQVYLVNLDGTQFTAAASETAVALVGPGLAFFNQSGIIQNSRGAVTADGLFAPGESRNSYIFRLVFEKSGSPSPSDASQTGRYWLSLRPYLYGDGDEANGVSSQRDDGLITQSMVGNDGSRFWGAAAIVSASVSNGVAPVAGTPWAASMVFQRATQRLWGISYDIGGTGVGGIWWAYHKATETAHDVATNSGISNDPIAGIALAGGQPRGIKIGADGTVYVAVSAGVNAGLVRIDVDLTVPPQQWLASGSALGAAVAGIGMDSSRARSGGAATASTNATNIVTVTDGAFTAADVARVIRLIGLAGDSGTYLISAVTDATHVTVTTLVGGAVTFTIKAGGQFVIGDRLYLFWNDTTSTPGKVTYTESLAFGTILTRTVAMTNGARVAVSATTTGAPAAVAVDPKNGNVYWYSTDTTTQLNKYDPAANTWARRLIAGDLNVTPAGGSGTIVAPTAIYCIGVNPHASFREVWCGTDQGWIKLDADNFAGAFARYYGTGAASYYQNGGLLRPHGSTRQGITIVPCEAVLFGPDGRVVGLAHAANTAEFVMYCREGDAWNTAESTAAAESFPTNPPYPLPAIVVTPYGELVSILAFDSSGISSRCYTLPIDYQWIGGAWVAKEVVRGALPDATSSPGCLTKPLHTTLDDLLYGVKCAFTPQGGATPANNEFVGRMGQTGPQRVDGATTNTSANFAGSGFSAADVGRYLRIESGADQGVYVVATYTNANLVTLKKLNPGTAWTATATAGTLSYTVWEMGAYGPEACTVLAANGFGKDNLQDITNINYEWYAGKTVLSEEIEAVKFAVPYVGPRGSPGPVVGFESFVRATNPQYPPNYPQGRALPAAFPLAEQLMRGHTYLFATGTNGRINTTSDAWRTTNSAVGVDPPSAAGLQPGQMLTVDFGCDVEVGAVVARIDSDIGASEIIMTTPGNCYGGLIANLHRAPAAGGAPALASAVRVSGTQLSLATNAKPVRNTGTPDFLGASTASAADGATALGGSIITSAAGRFTGGEGWVLRLTSGVDVGYYRVTAVSPDGSQVTIRNLDMTAKTFAATATALSFDIHGNATREDDIVSVAANGAMLTVERLIDRNTAEFRCQPHTAIVTAAWNCLIPTWALVKRCSYSVVAQPPDVANNGTYSASDAREGYYPGVNAVEVTAKLVFDLSDLATAKRTGRYWKFSMVPRFGASSAFGAILPFAFEFYDTAGKRLDLLPDEKIDTIETQPNMLGCHLVRVNWIQASNAAASHVAGTNGLATISGALGNTVTCAGGKFLGFEVRAGTGGNAPGASGVFNAGGSDPIFVTSDVGRFIRFVGGANAGVIARIASVTSPTQVVVALAGSGGVLLLAADAGPIEYHLHEGIAVGVGVYDYIRIAGVEYPIIAISDSLATITLGNTFLALAGQTWEIRRRGTPVTGAPGVDATKIARILYSDQTWAMQPGDVVQDPKGVLGFFATDVNAASRTGGSIAGGNGVFTGTFFTPDDVGRILIVTSGTNTGHYRVSVYTNATTVTLVDARTGGALVLIAQAGITYKMAGERRFRLSRYVTVLRN